MSASGAGKPMRPSTSSPAGRGVEELGQEHDRARLHRAADVHRLVLVDRLLELRHRLADRHRRGAVEHDAHRALLAVHADQHHRAREVGVEQRRGGEQQLAGERFRHDLSEASARRCAPSDGDGARDADATVRGAIVSEIREFDVVVARRRARRGGVRRAPGRRRPARSRSSSASSSAANAPSTRACPPRRCCAPPRRSPRRAGCRARPRPPAASSTSRAVLDRRDEVIHDLDDAAQLPWLEKRAIALVRGHGELVGRARGAASARSACSARRAVVLAPGTRGRRSRRSPGCARPIRGRTARSTTAEAIPASLLVLGGGVVGVEMAQAYASLGAQRDDRRGASRA